MPLAKRAISSALAQVDVQFNVVIIDNGACKQLSTFLTSINDKRIELYTYHEAVDIEDNWARVLDVKLNQYITIIGHDDFLYPEFLAEISKAISLYPDYTLFGSKGNIVDNKFKKLRELKLKSGKISLNNYLDERFNFKKDVSGTGYVFSSKHFKSIGGLPKFKNLFFSDDAFWISLLLRGNGFIIEKPCYDVMVHQHSVSTTSPEIGIDLLAALVSFAVFLNKNINIENNQKIICSKDRFLSRYLNLCAILIIIQNLKSNNNLNEDVFRKILHAQKKIEETGSKQNLSKAVYLFKFYTKIIPSYVIAKLIFKIVSKIRQKLKRISFK